MLFPTNIVPMKCDGCLMNFPKMLPLNLPCFLLSSIFNLLAVMKEISYPEKKAEIKIVKKIKNKIIPIIGI